MELISAVIGAEQTETGRLVNGLSPLLPRFCDSRLKFMKILRTLAAAGNWAAIARHGGDKTDEFAFNES